MAALCSISSAVSGSKRTSETIDEMTSLKNLYEKGLLSDQVYASQKRKLVGTEEHESAGRQLPAHKLLQGPSKPLGPVISSSFWWSFVIILGTMVIHLWWKDDYKRDRKVDPLPQTHRAIRRKMQVHSLILLPSPQELSLVQLIRKCFKGKGTSDDGQNVKSNAPNQTQQMPSETKQPQNQAQSTTN